MDCNLDLKTAFEAETLEDFLTCALPASWGGVRARILESGATFAQTDSVAWAPRWSPIPRTVKQGATLRDTRVKSAIYRVHDCLHQLWGLADPGAYTLEEFYYYKRVQMCGEVAVLTLTEFAYADWLRRVYPECSGTIMRRNAVPMLEGPLAGKSLEDIAARLDGLLHRHIRPRWVREDLCATRFVCDYLPMLEDDRGQIDANWELMRAAGWSLGDAPRAPFGPALDGLELTLWMIRDFQSVQGSSPVVDWGLAHFNRERRARIQLPEGWQS